MFVNILLFISGGAFIIYECKSVFMSGDNPADEWRAMYRRDVLAATGAATVGGLAGCLGDDDDGGGGSGENGDVDNEEEFAEFDPLNPEWPQSAQTLEDNDFIRGNIDWLENVERRDEQRYGDPVPETPDDEDEWLEPDTLLISRGPSEDSPEAYRDAYNVVLENIEAETGLDTEYFEMNEHAAGIEAMRSERLHVASFSTGTVPYAVNIADAVPAFAGVSRDESFGYRLFATTMMGSDINSVEDFAGREIAHTSETSNSGHQAPSALFEGLFGVQPGEDYEIQFSGSHEASTRGMHAGDFEAGPVCSSCISRTYESADFSADEFKVVWASDPFPSGPMCYRYNLHPDIIEGIETAFLDYDYEGTLYEEELDASQFVEVDYATHWDIILTIHEANEIEYGEGLQ